MAAADNGQDYQRWLAKINQVCGNFAARPLDSDFHGEIDASYAGNLKVSTVTARGVNLYRTRNEIRRDNDAWFYTVFQLSGQAAIEQDDRQVVLEAGDITLIDASRPCSIFWQQTSRQASLLLPRQLLEQQLRGSEISIATRLGKSLPMVQLSQRLLHESMSSPALSQSESEAALEAIVCLLRPMLHHHDAQPSRREKQFQKIMALIDESIQAEHLRPEWLAGETGMSVRSLYRLFADKGLVVAQYIKNRRLDLCARALSNAHDDEKLAGIGYSWGFSDHSHFSTAFKQRFGVSPGEYRKRCR
ncbi:MULTISPECIES: transcriptional regulator FeaR [Raoultella]|jgi:AraC family transcriptional activator of tynA and feaB|uniref:Transcriptional activator feaR n=2 Tax=Raoultella TaxID=160674 RepID=A0A1V2BV24_RAOTE|nr:MULTISPECIES: transcriptional regulator FeaR [Raoultella]AJF72916.1 transcriptional regulator [Raoultella ornithinolytica]HCR58656.1 transcriptional regulator FeaR [Raoultella sp.]MCF6689039.1 transcriptional regulator FeaR [Raoultella terrigena]MCS4269576.1 AraC family transcriptional activator of tynA and feaB [Raoultella sp. BIGb0132]MCS4286535.1 AraC family transcriptional activator of tynA and feaB [Raoultella terrigena]